MKLSDLPVRLQARPFVCFHSNYNFHKYRPPYSWSHTSTHFFCSHFFFVRFGSRVIAFPVSFELIPHASYRILASVIVVLMPTTNLGIARQLEQNPECKHNISFFFIGHQELTKSTTISPIYIHTHEAR